MPKPPKVRGRAITLAVLAHVLLIRRLRVELGEIGNRGKRGDWDEYLKEAEFNGGGTALEPPPARGRGRRILPRG